MGLFVAAVLFSLSHPAYAQGLFMGLGDLPGGIFYSASHAVSADGSTVVGSSESASGLEAFRWTSGGGVVGLGDLPGAGVVSMGRGVTADGLTVVGTGWNPSGRLEAWIAVLGPAGPPVPSLGAFGIALLCSALGAAGLRRLRP